MPNTKVTKIQDNKSILIELENSGWKFYSNDGTIEEMEAAVDKLHKKYLELTNK